MQINDKKHGFILNRMKKIPEIKATVYGFTHEQSGAELTYFERCDDNKTFAISFGTPPEDNTGIFHIIEHSVLCGSKKYPLKDPFAELLKGSLNTFLNAVTYEDRTVYPVSSRCEKDFFNLVDVYMDAVFSPMMLENPNIFKQEGWHYEYDEKDDRLSYNGVVYNEMKGVYSSPDDLGGMELSRLLFEGTPYGYDSGGNPSHIPELTYENFRLAHEKYYHPSNAKIILDGEIDLDRLFPLLSLHLSRFEKREISVCFTKSAVKITPPKKIYYEIPQNEDPKGRARILFGSVYSDYADKEARLTSIILADILASTNASPLKKALLERGLAKDATVYMNRAKEQTVTIEIRDIDIEEDKISEVTELVESVIRNLAKGGIDKTQLSSVFNSIEFKLREQDHGTLPKGIANALSAYAFWNYGDAPENALLLEDTLRSLKEKINTGYFERELLRMTVDNPHRATLIMIPDKNLGEKVKKEEAEALEMAKARMTELEIEKIIEEDKALKLWQECEDNDESLASIPTLSLSDISEKANEIKTEAYDCMGAKILRHSIETNGIVYISLYFDASDLSGDELATLSLLSALLVNSRTEKRDALTLQSDIKANLGSFFITTSVNTRDKKTTPSLKVTSSLLSSKCDDYLEISADVLLHSVLTDTKELSDIVAQIKSQIEDSIIASGESVALARVEASVSQAGAVSEHLNGYEFYKSLLNISSENLGKYAENISRLAKKIITRERLTVSLAGECDEDLPRRIVSIFPETADLPVQKTTDLCAEKSEFFVIPSKVAYSAMGGYSDKITKNLGFMRVAHTILSYEYLWNTVRVKNGAYGTGFIPRRDGNISFYSYRDPSPKNSLKYYRESTKYLRDLALSDTDLTKFIIGTIGEYDILTTPRTKAQIAATHYLNGWTPENEEAVRAQILAMKPSNLLLVADIIDEVLASASIAVVGGREHLSSMPEKPEKIIEI